MPVVADFRRYAFDVARVNASGKNVGSKVYWKLFVIENLVRVVVHSILTVQVAPAPNWWVVAVDPRLQQRVRKRQAQYPRQPWHSLPGTHEIYYTLWPGLCKIMAENSHLFRPIVQDIDQWVTRIEQVRIPRNIVGHGNWLVSADRQRIDMFLADLEQLVRHLPFRGIGLTIP